MKTLIRSRKFTMGMILFLGIILLLSISSGYYLNRLSSKTSDILSENHNSVVYARDMSENLININQGIVNQFVMNKNLDTLAINNEFKLFTNSLNLEKNNITEVGEDVLALNIETNYNEYHNLILKLINSPKSTEEIIDLQKKFDAVYQQLLLLSKMNQNAIVEKTDDAKFSAKRYTLQMTFIATLCFLIAYGYTFIFSSYFNERFYNLYNGIKEVVLSNYRQRLDIKGNDELSEISTIINQMAEKLDKTDKSPIISID
jgi:NtrC-family two-component system sensor histidine kinase KinB